MHHLIVAFLQLLVNFNVFDIQNSVVLEELIVGVPVFEVLNKKFKIVAVNQLT
jgi:hypothetical protein